MQKKIMLAIVLVFIVGAIVFLQNPDVLQQPTTSDGTPVDMPLGVVANPSGDNVGLEIGKAAPDFALQNLDGDVVKLNDFRGKKFVAVNLWASWCGPCKVEMPDLEDVYQKHGDELVILGVDLQESVADINAFLKNEVSVSYPILLDDKGEVAAGYNKFTQPTTFLIDKNGVIQARKFGAYVKEELEAAIEKLLNPDTPDRNAFGEEAQNTNTLPETTSAPKPEVEVLAGNVNRNYFFAAEQRQLGLDVDLENVPYLASLNLDKFLMGCPLVDCIPSIDTPTYITVEESNWMQEDHLIIAVSYNGINRAYPTGILNYHEIVNDDFAGTPMIVNYCPLCYSATAFVAPTIEGQVAQFGVSGRLYNSDLIMYDRVTGSMWSQIQRTVIVGPLTGRAPELEFIPVNMTTWGQWARAYPDGEVLARPTYGDFLGGKPPRTPGVENPRLRQNYEVYPYQTYETNQFDIRFPVDIVDRRLNNKDVVIGVDLAGNFKAYPKTTVVAETLINDEIAGVPVVVVYDEVSGEISVLTRSSSTTLTFEEEGILTDGTDRWDLKGQSLSGANGLEPVFSLPAFWFSWQAFHPNESLYLP